MRIRKNHSNIQRVSSEALEACVMDDEEGEIFDDDENNNNNNTNDANLDDNLTMNISKEEEDEDEDDEPDENFYHENQTSTSDTNNNNNNTNIDYQTSMNTYEANEAAQVSEERDIIIFTGNVRKRRRLARITTTINGTTEITTSLTPKPSSQTQASFFYYSQAENEKNLTTTNNNNNNSDLAESKESQQSTSQQIRLPLIIDYFYVVTWISSNGEVIKGKCKFCSYEFNCKMKPTSNFSKHAQIHDKLFIEYMKAKEGNRIRRSTLNKSLQSQATLRNSSNNLSINENKTEASEVLTNTPLISLGKPTMLTKPSQLSIEKKVTKLIVSSFLTSNLVESNVFNEFVELFEPSFEKISRVKFLNKLIPELYESTETRLRQLLELSGNDACSIRVDFFNDQFLSGSVNFVGFSVCFIDSDWRVNNHTLACFKLSHQQRQICAQVLHVKNKLGEVCKRFGVKSVFRVQVDQAPCLPSLWQCFRRWSLPGVELLAERFFEIDTVDCGLDNGEGEDAFEEGFHDDTEVNEDVDNTQEYLRSSEAKLNWEWAEHSKLIDSLDFGCEKTPCLLDVLNLCVRETMLSIFASTLTDDKTTQTLCTTLRQISRTFSKHRSKSLISHISKINSLPNLPHWCKQLILIKKMFKLESYTSSSTNTTTTPTTNTTSPTTNSYSMLKLNPTQRILLKEFIFLFEPLCNLVIELNTELSLSKVMPFYLSLMHTYQQMTLFSLNELKKKLEENLRQRLEYLVAEPVYRLAAVLDPKFGTQWAKPIEKTRLELLLVEHLCLQNEFINFNNSKKSSHIKTNDSSCNLNTQFKYMVYDEAYLAEKSDTSLMYREEVASYLKFIRANFNQPSNDLMRFWCANAKKWPSLAKLARKIYSVQSASNGVERTLNLNASQHLSNHSDQSHLEKIIFLKCNQNLS